MATNTNKSNKPKDAKIEAPLKIEFTAIEVDSLISFMTNQPMKMARPFMPVIQFLEGKLKAALEEQSKPKVAES